MARSARYSSGPDTSTTGAGRTECHWSTGITVLGAATDHSLTFAPDTHRAGVGSGREQDQPAEVGTRRNGSGRARICRRSSVGCP